MNRSHFRLVREVSVAVTCRRICHTAVLVVIDSSAPALQVEAMGGNVMASASREQVHFTL